MKALIISTLCIVSILSGALLARATNPVAVVTINPDTRLQTAAFHLSDNQLAIFYKRDINSGFYMLGSRSEIVAGDYTIQNKTRDIYLIHNEGDTYYLDIFDLTPTGWAYVDTYVLEQRFIWNKFLPVVNS